MVLIPRWGETPHPEWRCLVCGLLLDDILIPAKGNRSLCLSCAREYFDSLTPALKTSITCEQFEASVRVRTATTHLRTFERYYEDHTGLTTKRRCFNCGKQLLNEYETCCDNIVECQHCRRMLEVGEFHDRASSFTCRHNPLCECSKCTIKPVPNYYVERFKMWWHSGTWFLNTPGKPWKLPRIAIGLFIFELMVVYHTCTLEPLPADHRGCLHGQIIMSPAGGMQCLSGK